MQRVVQPTAKDAYNLLFFAQSAAHSTNPPQPHVDTISGGTSFGGVAYVAAQSAAQTAATMSTSNSMPAPNGFFTSVPRRNRTQNRTTRSQTEQATRPNQFCEFCFKILEQKTYLKLFRERFLFLYFVLFCSVLFCSVPFRSVPFRFQFILFYLILSYLISLSF